MNELNRRIELEALITERDGMIALNMQRESLGQSMAYGDDAFLDVAAKMMALIETEPAPAYTPEDVARLVEAAKIGRKYIAHSEPRLPDHLCSAQTNCDQMCAEWKAWVENMGLIELALAPFKEKP